jgi:hypothetical protein
MRDPNVRVSQKATIFCTPLKKISDEFQKEKSPLFLRACPFGAFKIRIIVVAPSM